jgi:16S rRNA (cytosine967-C5)-methyltransferase
MMPPVPGAAVRAGAARVVCAVRFEGVSLKAALPPVLATIADARDRALCEAMAFETCRWTLRYEPLLARMLERPLPSSLRIVHCLLLVGLAQIEAMRLADHAAISSTAEAARTLRHPRYVGLVNAVLRRYLREREALDAAARTGAVGEHAHPAWLIEALQLDWPEHAAAILRENNCIAPLWLRVNARQGSRDAYLARLSVAGFDASPSAIADSALCLEHGASPTRLPGWNDGAVSVQDLSAQLTAAALDIGPGQRVLDACAAPGGKSAHLLERDPAPERLLALDLDARRLQRIRDNLDRLGLQADVRQADAARPESWFDGWRFDRILLDAPCSGSGVIRRQPDIKLHRRAADVPGLVAVQARLLDALWPLLLPGGRLVYATCSVLKEENEHQIHAFLARTPDARPIALGAHFGHDRQVGRQRLPGDDGGDGFFHAAISKDG